MSDNSNKDNEVKTESLPELQSKISSQKKKEYTKLAQNDNIINTSQSLSTDDNAIDVSSNSQDTSTKTAFDISSPSEEDQSYFYKRIGKVYSFFANKNGDPLLIIGPQWPMYIFLTGLVFAVVVTFLYCFWDIYTTSFKVIGIIFLFLFQLSYTYTFVINPGYPHNDNDRKNGEPREDFRFCSDCKFYVSVHKKVNHCYDCGICVEGYDHHCPWTSKCIGRKNLYSFYMFMTSIMLIFGYFIWSLTSAATIE